MHIACNTGREQQIVFPQSKDIPSTSWARRLILQLLQSAVLSPRVLKTPLLLNGSPKMPTSRVLYFHIQKGTPITNTSHGIGVLWGKIWRDIYTVKRNISTS